MTGYHGREFGGVRCSRVFQKKYVRLVKETYEDARTQVNTSIGVTGNITVRAGLHQ